MDTNPSAPTGPASTSTPMPLTVAQLVAAVVFVCLAGLPFIGAAVS